MYIADSTNDRVMVMTFHYVYSATCSAVVFDIVHRPFSTNSANIHVKVTTYIADNSLLVSKCFNPSRPQRNISGLREIYMKRYMVERANKTETRPEGQSEKAESYLENLWNEIQLKGP